MSAVKSALMADSLGPEQMTLVRENLKQVLASKSFAGSKRAQDFLQLLVEHVLAGRLYALRERMIGAEMFGRPVDYDTANDAVVRVKASEVRRKLAQYYAEAVEVPRVRITLPVGSYVPQFLVEAEATIDSVAIPEVQSPAGTVKATKPVRSAPIGKLSMLLGFALLLVWLGFLAWRLIAPQRIHSIAVLPLLNLSGDPNQDYFADGLTEDLIAELGQVNSLRVISRTSSMTYKNTRKTLPEIARELNVDSIAEGSVVHEGAHVRVTIQLIDSHTDQHLWARTYDRDLTSVLELQSNMARGIAEQIRIELKPEEKARLNRPRKADPQVVDLYLRAVEKSSADDFQDAIALFRAALAKDPRYAPAHYGLAAEYGWMGELGWMPYPEAFSQQRSEAMRAVELDDSRPEPHLEIGFSALNQEFDWVTFEKELKRARELNASGAVVHWATAKYLQRLGRLKDGVEEGKEALRSDPVSQSAHSQMAYLYYYARQYDDALAMLRQGVAPHTGLFITGVVSSAQSRYDDAIRELDQLGDAPHALGHKGYALALAGRTADARAVISKLEQSITKADIGRYEIAMVYAGFKDKDATFYWLEQAFRVRDKGIIYLQMDPCLDGVRRDPRFQSLVRRVGFPTSSDADAQSL